MNIYNIIEKINNLNLVIMFNKNLIIYFFNGIYKNIQKIHK